MVVPSAPTQETTPAMPAIDPTPPTCRNQRRRAIAAALLIIAANLVGIAMLAPGGALSEPSRPVVAILGLG